MGFLSVLQREEFSENYHARVHTTQARNLPESWESLPLLPNGITADSSPWVGVCLVWNLSGIRQLLPFCDGKACSGKRERPELRRDREPRVPCRRHTTDPSLPGHMSGEGLTVRSLGSESMADWPQVCIRSPWHSRPREHSAQSSICVHHTGQMHIPSRWEGVGQRVFLSTIVKVQGDCERFTGK